MIYCVVKFYSKNEFPYVSARLAVSWYFLGYLIQECTRDQENASLAYVEWVGLVFSKQEFCYGSKMVNPIRPGSVFGFSLSYVLFFEN